MATPSRLTGYQENEERMIRIFTLVSIVVSLALFAPYAFGANPGAAGPRSPVTAPPLDRAALADEVREEFVRVWRAYARYAWGHDELKPLSRAARDWYGESLLVTPVDALDTMILMHLP